MSAAWLTVAEAAGRWRCDVHTVYDAVNAGTIPHQRIGRSVRIPAAGVDANAAAVANGSATAPLDVDELADAVADRLLARLARLLVGTARATVPAEAGTVVDLFARDDEVGRHDRTAAM